MKFVVQIDGQLAAQPHTDEFVVQIGVLYIDIVGEPSVRDAAFHFHVAVGKRKGCVVVDADGDARHWMDVLRK